MRSEDALPGSDLDLMRDVYMTRDQRAAFARIVNERNAALARAEADAARLDWLTRNVSGAELRRIGVEWPAWSPEYSRAAIDAIAQHQEADHAS